MDQLGPFNYRVRPRTTVTLIVTSVQTSPTVTAAQNGKPVEVTDVGGVLDFSFDVTEPVGNIHFMQVEYTFQAGDPDTAEYEVEVTNSDGSHFSSQPIKKTDIIKDPRYEFEVV